VGHFWGVSRLQGLGREDLKYGIDEYLELKYLCLLRGLVGIADAFFSKGGHSSPFEGGPFFEIIHIAHYNFQLYFLAKFNKF